MTKRDTFKKNIPKKLRRKIRNISNGHRKARVLVRPRKYQKRY